MTYLIKNGHVVDPANNIDGPMDVIVSEGKIAGVARDIAVPSGAVVIDVKGKIVSPGFIDMHTHMREPGREDEETVRSATRAAVKGGFTTVVSMPNTDPAVDNPIVVRRLNAIIKKDALCNVVVAGTITEGRNGLKLTEFLKMKEDGVKVFSDDGSSVDDQALLAGALSEAETQGVLIIEHCEDKKLSAGGVMNAGLMATKMGLRGISKASEYERVRRNVDLARKKLASIHIAHVSTAESADIIRQAKSSGVKVTAETAPHYFSLNEVCAATYDTNTKMNPPLRTVADSEAIKRALADGTIDAIATDHAPHTDAEKDVEFDLAPFGIIGLETALSLSVMELIETGVLTWPQLITKLSLNPSRILKLRRGTLSAGAEADITVMDPAKSHTYTKESVVSKSRNSPFIDWKLKGAVTHVFARGELVLKDGKLCA